MRSAEDQNGQYRNLKKSLEDLHGNQKDVQEKARQAGGGEGRVCQRNAKISVGTRMNMMNIAWRS